MKQLILDCRMVPLNRKRSRNTQSRTVVKLDISCLMLESKKTI